MRPAITSILPFTLAILIDRRAIFWFFTVVALSSVIARVSIHSKGIQPSNKLDFSGISICGLKPGIQLASIADVVQMDDLSNQHTVDVSLKTMENKDCHLVLELDSSRQAIETVYAPLDSNAVVLLDGLELFRQNSDRLKVTSSLYRFMAADDTVGIFAERADQRLAVRFWKHGVADLCLSRGGWKMFKPKHLIPAPESHQGLRPITQGPDRD